MSASSAASPLNDLASLSDEWKYGPGKNLIIVRSSSAIVSVAASALLVWIIFRSRNGINTTYHRLLLGLSISDMLLSLSFATFGAVVPSELNYVVWNARGSLASCDALGFIQALGLCSGLLYMCSLNLYYLAKVKFNKTDTYIAKKLEPWLHLVPTLFGAIMSVVLLAKQSMNAAIDGICTAVNTHEPPHCNGHEDGDTPEGFEIPCGRGRNAETIVFVMAGVIFFLVPITLSGCLLIIYRSVLRAERRIARYGAGSLQIIRARPTTNDGAATSIEGGGGGGGVALTMLSTVSSRFGGAPRANSDNQESSQSRAVLQKAAAYSVAYFVTWIWNIIFGVLALAGAWKTYLPQPEWQIAYRYVWLFFLPLQGLWTLLIYMQPNVIQRKRSSGGNISWFGAFADALWSAVTVRTNSVRCGRNQAGPSTQGTTAATGRTGTNPTPAPKPQARNTSTTVGSNDRQGDSASTELVGLGAEDPEEEKREVKEYEPSV